MNTHTLFQQFNDKIKLSSDKKDELRKNRDSLRGKIREYFSSKKWEAPKFYPQGSFSLGTNLNPISQKDSDGNTIKPYDLDDGGYSIGPIADRLTPDAYHSRIVKAVEGHASKVIDKNTCVRVVYADGHHIDIPYYWLEKEGAIPQLAHKTKGFIESDPREFSRWVKEQMAQSDNGQVKRLIRCLKAWKDWRQLGNSQIKLMSGIVITVLICENYRPHERDDIALRDTVRAIEAKLNISFSCYRPTPSTDENLLDKYHSSVVMSELQKLLDIANKAIDSDCEEEASKFWQKVFGDRFPTGKKKPNKVPHIAIPGSAAVLPNVAATKPYYSHPVSLLSQAQPPAVPMMRYTEADFLEISSYFPGLRYDKESNCIIGTIKFCSKYEQKRNTSWEIAPADGDEPNAFSGEYSMLINLNRQSPQPQVYEISGKIKKVADRLGVRLIELHMYGDGSLCLDYVSTNFRLPISLSAFILNKVYPFFAWQAYYETYGKKPPCGDHPHDRNQREVFLKQLKDLKPNDKCLCGSGRKFKHCCKKQ